MKNIITPDQKIRVFISSTIEEMASERNVVKKVIEQLRLTPIYFESGAKPYPPKEVYQSYLNQSDIFIGLYWNSYGWIAPDMKISGLEDEWNLSENKPKLIYIKESQERTEGLTALIDKIRKSNLNCYQKFSTMDELEKLVCDDLSHLITERFYNAKEAVSDHKNPSNLPFIRSKIIGRNAEINYLINQIRSDALITLIGPGGIGKTRLAIELGHSLLDRFRDGILFISLASIRDANQVPIIIAQHLGIQTQDKEYIKQDVIEILRNKFKLIILDNFEQILEASLFVSEILLNCEHVKIIVTSRTPLYIKSENVYSIEPLEIKKNGLLTVESPAIQLFVERAKEANSKINWTEENIQSTMNICQLLDGLPLAIELAAARCRYFDPTMVEKKMNSILDSVGPKDSPDRQKTLRNTIQWSYDLLQAEDQRLFRRLNIFINSWSFDAAEKICWEPFHETAQLEESMNRLSDTGLIERQESHYNSYKILQIIKEFAAGKLRETNEEKILREVHCNYYERIAFEHSEKIWFQKEDPSHLNIQEDSENIIAALHYSIEQKNLKQTWSLLNSLNSIYMVNGEVGYLLEWMKQANINSRPENIPVMLSQHSKAEVALSMLAAGFLRSSTNNIEEGIRDLNLAEQLAIELDIPQILASSNLFKGIALTTLGKIFEAEPILVKSIKLHQEIGRLPGKIAAETTLYFAMIERDEMKNAEELLARCREQSKLAFMPLVESYTLYQSGYFYHFTGQFNRAIEFFNSSIEVNNKYKLRTNCCYPFIGLILTYVDLNELDTAKENIPLVIECIRYTGNNTELICYCFALCYFLCKNQQLEVGLRLYAHLKLVNKQDGFVPWKPNAECLEKAYSLLLEKFTEDYMNDYIRQSVPLRKEEIFSMV